MPVLLVYGVNPEMGADLERYCEALIETAASVEELQLKESDVSCFFPADLLKKGLGEEIIVSVQGLFDKPERTEEIRNKLAKCVVEITYQYFPHTKLVECFVTPFDPRQGFFAQ
jgi:hypothetical protein